MGVCLCVCVCVCVWTAFSGGMGGGGMGVCVCGQPLAEVCRATKAFHVFTKNDHYDNKNKDCIVRNTIK